MSQKADNAAKQTNSNSDEIARSIIQPIVDEAAGDTKPGGTHSKPPLPHNKDSKQESKTNNNKSSSSKSQKLPNEPSSLQFQKSSSNRHMVFHPDHPEKIYDLDSTSTAPSHSTTSRSPEPIDSKKANIADASLVSIPRKSGHQFIQKSINGENEKNNPNPHDATNGNKESSRNGTNTKNENESNSKTKKEQNGKPDIKNTSSSSSLSREARRERRRRLEDPNCFPKRYEVQVQARVRVGKELTSQHLTDLPEGSVVTVEEISGHRARISRPLCGWLSVTSKFGARIILPTNSKYSKIGGKVMFKRPIHGQQVQAKVIDYNEENNLYKIRFDDNNSQWIDIEDPNIQFISQHKAVKVQKPLNVTAPTFTLQTSQAFFNQFFCKDYPQYQAQSSSTTRHIDISPAQVASHQHAAANGRGYGSSHGGHGAHGGSPNVAGSHSHRGGPTGHGPHGGPPHGYPPSTDPRHGGPPRHPGHGRHGGYPPGPHGGPVPYPPPPHGSHTGHGQDPSAYPPHLRGQPRGPHHGYPPNGAPPTHPTNGQPPPPHAGYPPHGHPGYGPHGAPPPGPHPQRGGPPTQQQSSNTPSGQTKDSKDNTERKRSDETEIDAAKRKKANEEFRNKVKEIERRIIQHLHQRGYDESHPDYHRYLQKAKELAIQKAGKEREKMLAAQREAGSGRNHKGVSRAEYEQYIRYRQEKQRQHAIAEAARKQRLAEEARRNQQPTNTTLTGQSKSSSSVKGLIVLRGLPGSGKTTLAKKLAQRSKNARICTEDRYHWSGKEDGVGEYKFQPQLVFLAREWCTKEIRECIENNVNLIILDNHNARISMYEDHIQYAVEHGYRFRIIEFVATASLIDKYRARSYKKFPREVYVKLLKLWEHDPRTELINPTFGDTPNKKNNENTNNNKEATKGGDDKGGKAEVTTAGKSENTKEEPTDGGDDGDKQNDAQ